MVSMQLRTSSCYLANILRGPEFCWRSYIVSFSVTVFITTPSACHCYFLWQFCATAITKLCKHLAPQYIFSQVPCHQEIEILCGFVQLIVTLDFTNNNDIHVLRSKGLVPNMNGTRVVTFSFPRRYIRNILKSNFKGFNCHSINNIDKRGDINGYNTGVDGGLNTLNSKNKKSWMGFQKCL